MNIKTILLCIIIGYTCTGCTVPFEFYVINDSSSYQKIRLKSKVKELKIDGLPYGEGTNEIRKENLSKTISIVRISAGEYEVLIPPKSIVFIEKGLNLNSFLFSSVEIAGQEVLDTNGVYSKKVNLVKLNKSYQVTYRIL